MKKSCLSLSCCSAAEILSPDIENPGDRVEVAFRRLDTDGDGYIEEEEFTQVKKLNLTVNPTSSSISFPDWMALTQLRP